MDFLNELKNFLISQKKLILEANSIDIKSNNDEIDFNTLIDCADFTNETRMFSIKLEGFANEQSKTLKLYDSYDLIGLDCEQNYIYPIVKMMFMSIFTNNSLVINLKEGKNYVTINMIATLINRFLKEKQSPLSIEVVNKDPLEFIHLYYVNKMFILSSKDYYLRNRELYECEVKFYCIDTPVIVIDNKAHVEYLKNINEDIIIYSTHSLKINENEIIVNDTKEAALLINKSEKLHKAILLTKDETNAKTFVNLCKCENVLINVVDLSIRMPNFDQKDFLYIKTYQTIK